MAIPTSRTKLAGVITVLIMGYPKAEYIKGIHRDFASLTYPN